MSEYKRFVAYFYEYIDGKKQKNAGFAKVELRNGLWRVLFRLTSAADPAVPAQVYGFVRENGYLLGIPLGMLNGKDNRKENGNEYGKEGRLMENPPQEWAWSAREPVGTGKYTFDQLNGIYVQSSDGRTFATVWDDEAVDPGRFVLEMPGAEMVSGKTTESVPSQEEVLPGLQGSEELQQPEEFPHPPEKYPPEEPAVNPTRQPEKILQPEIQPSEKPTEHPQEIPEPSEISPEEPAILPVEAPPLHTWELPNSSPSETTQPGSLQIPSVQSVPAMSHSALRDFSEKDRSHQSLPHVRTGLRGAGNNAGRIQKRESTGEMLLHSRQQFQPFQDDELTDCVQIRLCDLTLLQQSGWPVGRNNFLQHGYDQYRHLLFGRSAEGDYVLGVPSVYSPREEYMAGVFGYNQFKSSSQYNCGRKFGYWYRILKMEEGEGRQL